MRPGRRAAVLSAGVTDICVQTALGSWDIRKEWWLMDGVYRTNVCGIEVAFYATGPDSETDALVEKVRERIRAIMNEGRLSVSKAAVMACLETEEENSRLSSEIKRLLDENEKLSAELRDLNIKNKTGRYPFDGRSR